MRPPSPPFEPLCMRKHFIISMRIRQMITIIATRCYILRLKCSKFDFSWGSASDTTGELTALPHVPWLDSRGPTSKERKRGKGKSERKKKGRGGKRGKKGRGRGERGIFFPHD